MKPIGAALVSLFADLERRSQAVVELTTRVRDALSGPEKDHVLSASYKEDTLLIEADSAAWCAHIRYAQTNLLAQLNRGSENRFTKLKVRVGRKRSGGG